MRLTFGAPPFGQSQPFRGGFGEYSRRQFRSKIANSACRLVNGQSDMDRNFVIMNNEPVTITIILDPEYGDRVRDVALLGPVWVAPSGTNRMAVERCWHEPAAGSYEVTYWSEPRTGSSEEEWIGILDSLDLHHSRPWAGPGIAAVHIIGASLTDFAQNALRAFGYEVSEFADHSFRAVRVEEQTFDAPGQQ